MRGGTKGPNYAAEFVRNCAEELGKAGLIQKIMVRSHKSSSLVLVLRKFHQIDCSHGNSSKQHRKQIEVAEDIVCYSLSLFPRFEDLKANMQACQLESCDTSPYIMGVMIESNLVEGRQNLPANVAATPLVYGQSVTDACISWESTVPVLERLRKGVHGRRLGKWRNAKITVNGKV